MMVSLSEKIILQYVPNPSKSDVVSQFNYVASKGKESLTQGSKTKHSPSMKKKNWSDKLWVA